MIVINKSQADKRERSGLISHFLLGQEIIPDTPLAVTWVTVEPGARQKIHHHISVQVYVIIQGGGLMHVGDETHQVTEGDLIYIPSDVPHGIENNTSQPLSYVSAATPSFSLPQAYDQGQLTPDAYSK
ncbi:MAG: cupin domain-containing protein [Chloroflexi bacterium]|nr:cupin domain-containing protein [Chloroflexota bacterium]